MRYAGLIVVIVGLAPVAAAAPPNGYQCYPGKPKAGVGCACPERYTDVRDAENTATCRPVPREVIPLSTKELQLIKHDWLPLPLPAIPIPPPQPRPQPIIPTGPEVPVHVVPTDVEIDTLTREVERTTGPGGFAPRHRLATSLAIRAQSDPKGAKARSAALAGYRALVEAPGFAAYAQADDVLAEYATLLGTRDEAEARKIFLQLVQSHPSSKHVPQAYLWFADRAFDAKDLGVARGAYELVVKFPASREYLFARFKLGLIDLDEAKLADAQRQLEQAAKSTDEMLKAGALQALARVYARSGAADKAFGYFEQLDRQTTFDMAYKVAGHYVDLGKLLEGRTVYRAIATRDLEVGRWACLGSAGALRVSVLRNQRDEVTVDADALATVARSGACFDDADLLFGEIASTWHQEHVKTRGDARATIEMWRRAEAHTGNVDRRNRIQRNLAIALWDQAASARGARALDWIAAGEALQASPITELAESALDAYDNALRVVRATGTKLLPPIAKRLRDGLAKIDSDRAKQLLRAVR